MPRIEYFSTVKSNADAPCQGQTTKQFKEWVLSKPLKVGDRVGIRHTQGQVWHYEVRRVEGVDLGRFKKIKVEGYEYCFHRSGKWVKAPTGQTRLVQATPEVIEAAERRLFFQCADRYIE